MTHTFDALIALEVPTDGAQSTPDAGPEGPRTVTARTHPAWANMVGPYGGATAAQALAGITADPRAQGRPAALTLNFAAPVEEGTMDIVVDPVRTNRSNQHWTVRIDQESGTVLTGTALLARGRETFTDTELSVPQVPAPADVDITPYQMALPWMENYVFRIVSGVPTAASESSETLMWVSQTQPRPWDHVSLAAACDVFFPRIFARTGTPSPAGTVSYTVYFHTAPEALAAQGEHLLCRAAASRFHEGHFDQIGHVWGEDGELLATTTQLVYFKGV
ncbi:MAG: thioesterase family protein [Brevibacterium yomogidense]|uniref:TesB-like acyl-CoA thioesterase 2 n=1 Tax=Brevibacterium yomogidense TaxID=946573 RepID=A0A1X6XFF6_9MICO|nr:MULTISPECIES: thioesterase family protein [Brevibacterium]SLM97843.1 TesB-like acyl-CoA thioesterase 2 [Brevibacterium yomogidense]SMX68447.1 Acyl-CoA thioesterase [Brevibacterium sp. Mu109]